MEVHMSERVLALKELGYEGPMETRCSRVIDGVMAEIMEAQAMHAVSILESVRGLVDNVFVFEAQEMLAESDSCFCAVWLRLKHGEMVVEVPWLAQYQQGAHMGVYRKGSVDEFEIELILAQLIGQLEFARTPNTQAYMQ